MKASFLLMALALGACKSTEGARLRANDETALPTARVLGPLKLWLGYRHQEIPGDDVAPAEAGPRFVEQVEQHITAVASLRATRPEISTYVFALAPDDVVNQGFLNRKVPDALVLEGLESDQPVSDLTVAHWQLFAVGQARQVVLPAPSLESGAPWTDGQTTMTVVTDEPTTPLDLAALQQLGLRDLIEYKALGFTVRISRWESEAPASVDQGIVYRTMRGTH